MKKLIWLLLIIIFLTNSLKAQGVFTSKATANWSTGTTTAFNLTSGSDEDGIPDADDDVIIASGHTITVNGTNSCKTLVINAASANNGITIASPNSLTVGAGSGSVTMNAVSTNSVNSTLAVGSGTLTCGNIAIAGSGTSSRNTILSISTGTVNCTGITFSGTAAQAQVTFTGAGSLKIASGTLGSGGTFTRSTGTVEFTTTTGGQTINSYTYYNLKLNNTSGTNTAAGNITMGTSGTLTTTSGGTFDMSTYTITFSSSNTITNNGTIQTQNTSATPFSTAQTWGGTGSIEYNGVNQTVVTGTYTSANLILSNSGTKTLPSSTIGGNLTMNGSVSASTVSSFAVSGNITLNGTSTLTIGSNAMIVGGLLTINSGTTWSNSTYTVTFRGGINNSGTFTSGSGIQTFSNNTQALTGTISITNMTITSITVTNNTSLTVTTALTGTGGLTQSSSASLTLGGTSSLTTLTASASSNTVEYSGAAQTVHSTTYVNLTLSGSGKKTMYLSSTVSGTLIISGTAYREYAETFDVTTTLTNFTTVNIGGSNFAINNGTQCTGTYSARLTASGSNDSYLITKAIPMKATYAYTVSFTHKRSFAFNIYVGTVNTTSISSGTNIFTQASGSEPTTCTSTSSTSSFVPSSDGVYYIGFRVTGNTTAAILDEIYITETTPATITWDGSSSTTWGTAANWDLNRVPNSTDLIIIPSGLSNYPSSITAGSYNSLTLNHGGSGTISIGAATFSGNVTLTSSSAGNTIVFASTTTVGGNLNVGSSGSNFNFTVNGATTVSGSFTLGNTNTAVTSSLNSPITSLGAFSMGNNSNHVTNIGYTSSTKDAITASNTGNFTFYGTVNYNASFGNQRIMAPTYHGPIIASNGGSRFMNGNLDINNSLTISGGNWFSGSSTEQSTSGVLGNDGNVMLSNSPYKGSGRSGRWQGIFLASDLGGVGANDLITSLSFYINTKYSDRAFNNFTIKAALVNYGSFTQSGLNWPFKSEVMSTVFTPKDVTTTGSAWNTHIFDTPLVWDGTSNILIEITFNNLAAAGGSGLAPDGTSDDQVAYIAGAWADNIIVQKSASNSDVTNATNGSNSNYKNYSVFNIANGPYNINITNNWTNSNGNFYHLQNTVTFDGSSNQNVTTNGDNYYNFTVQNTSTSSALTLLDNCNIENTATLTDGVIVTGNNKFICLSTNASKLTGYSNISFIQGNLRRYIATNTSTYGFPLGKGTNTTNYFLSEIVNNNLTGITYLDGKFVGATPADYTQATFAALGKQMSGAGVSTRNLNTLDSQGYTQLDPNTQPSGGTYSIRLYNTNYTLGDWVDDGQCIMKRPSSSNNLNDFNMAGNINPDGGLGRKVSDGYLLSTGLTTFSEFIPGLEDATPLPIELYNFNVKYVGDKVKINWTTLSEINNDYFTIEKSNDGIHFNEVTKIKGKGNTTHTSHYHTFDYYPQNGINYYRLKQTDFDGKYSYSNIESIYVIHKSFDEPIIYPNPTSENKVNIKFSTDDDIPVKIKIFSNDGKVIIEKNKETNKGVNVIHIDLDTNLTKGIYILELKNEFDILREKIHIN
jgi:hypothetical protein